MKQTLTCALRIDVGYRRKDHKRNKDTGKEMGMTDISITEG
jgi:hypothetical protein